MTFRAFSIGFSAALLALACGSEDTNNGDDDDNEPDDVVVVPRETCEDNALLDGCDANTGTGNPSGPDPGGPDEPTEPTDDPLAFQRAAAQNVLESNCGGCHGPQLDAEDVEAGMNYINDFEQLVENGKVEPLDSQGSYIIERMTDGSMPPAYSGRPAVTQSDIDIVAQYIDNPLAWPTYATPETCNDQLFTYDELYEEVAEDLADLDEDDALTARYISLTNRYTSGVCANTALDRDRQAITKMVNALSTDTSVTAPLAIDTDRLIFRIDLEDYGWEQPVDVVDADGNIVNFVDKWEAIVANNPYAVPFVGDQADDAVADSGTLVPVMFADSMLDVAIIGNLYYALIDVDVTQTLDNFIAVDLEIDVAANLLNEDQMRAGTTRSRISRQDRVLQRDDIEIRAGVLWQSFDFLDDQNDSIFEDPFGFAEGGTEAIFTLPNGMFGYIIADENGLIVEDSDILLDTQQNNFRAVTSASCSSCHNAGLIPVEDEVRDIAIANALSSDLDRNEIEQLEAVYPSADVFARQIEADTNDFYRDALGSLQLPVQGADPISTVFLRFDQDIDLRTAAGDLGVSEAQLERNLQLLQPEINVLGNTRVDRDDFTQFYVNSLCELSGVNENQPDPVVCDAAEALLDL